MLSVPVGAAAVSMAAAAEPVVAPAAPAAVQPLAPQPTPLGDRWTELVQRLAAQGRITALVRELAWQAGAVACDDEADGSTWTLLVERETLRADSLRDKLATVLGNEAGRPQRLVLTAGVPGDSPARRDAWERQRRQAEAERLIQDDPAVQQVLAQFGSARIVPNSIRPL